MVQNKAVWVKHSQSSLLLVPDTESTLHVVHGQNGLCSSRIVETLDTYRKLHTTKHTHSLDFSERLLPLPHINKKSLWNAGKIKSAPVPGAPVIVSALIYKQ